MSGMSVGPFVFGADRLAAIGAVMAFLTCLALWRRWAWRTGQTPSLPDFAVIVSWVLAARIGFVLTHRDVFASHPFDILAIWQGGFSPIAGLIGAAVVVAVAALRDGRTFAPLVTAMAVAGVVAAAVPALLPPAGPDSLPPMVFHKADGTPVSLNDGDPRPLVVNLWATWCPPCRRELPMMMEVAAATPDARIVFANQGETLSQVQDFLAAEGLSQADILLDPNSDLMHHFEALGLPTTLFFDAQGNLTNALTGEVSRAALMGGIASVR